MNIITSTLELVKSFNIIENKAQIVHSILAQVEPKVASNWLNQVEVKEGHLAHTFYGENADHMTFNQFTSLYEALGCSHKQFTEIKDKACKQVLDGYFDKTESTCDDSYC